MKRRGLSTFVFVFVQTTAWLVCTGLANEEPASSDPGHARGQLDTEIDPSLFTRAAVEFDVQKEPQTRQLVATNPDVLKQTLQLRYMAAIQLLYPIQRGNPALSSRSQAILKEEVLNVAYYKDLPLVPVNRSRHQAHFQPSEYFSQLVASIPKERLPAKEVLSFFTGAVDESRLCFYLRRGRSDETLMQFELLAPTEDRARELAKTFLFLLDWGLTRRVQTRLREARHETEQQIEEKRRELEQASAKLQPLRQQLETPAKVNAESLTELRTQRHLLAVDLAGVQARIEAAARFLSPRTPLAEGLRVQVENIKIAAEIELAGLKARQEALNSLIKSGEQRIELEGQARNAEEQFGQAKVQVSNCESRIRELDQDIERLGPFRLHNGKVVIQPIEWVTPAPPRKSAAPQ